MRGKNLNNEFEKILKKDFDGKINASIAQSEANEYTLGLYMAGGKEKGGKE